MTDDQTNCIECGARILIATAGENGGLCIPCKRGTRTQIEENRQWHAKEKAYRQSSEYLAWRELWKRLVSTEFEKLSVPEQQYFAVSCVSGEVYNGGFDQYFSNSSGDHYVTGTKGLLAMGAGRSLDLLRRAKTLLFGSAPVPNRAARWAIQSRLSGDLKIQAALNELDTAFWADPDDLGTALERFARLHKFYPPAC